MADAIPSGSEGLIPHLVVDGAGRAIDFYKEAFGAEEVIRMPSPDGEKLMHAEIRIGDQLVYLADDFPEMTENGTRRAPSALGTSSVTIHQYTNDCDASVARPEKAGATVTMPPQDMFWGDRYGTVQDPFGHIWSFATHIQDLSPEELAEAAKVAFS